MGRNEVKRLVQHYSVETTQLLVSRSESLSFGISSLFFESFCMCFTSHTLSDEGMATRMMLDSLREISTSY